MKSKNIIIHYITGTFLLMSLACITFLFLNQYGYMKQDSLGNIFVLTIGGLSSAIFGVIVSKKSSKVSNYRMLIKEFFNLKQPLNFYAIVILFLIISFGIPVFSGQFRNDIAWYSFFQFFFVALLFGGVEEIGWRYTFQPAVEKYVPFWFASIITWCCWSIWHIMYFVIVDSIATMNLLSVLLGLLSSCFILGAIYRISQSLWLCVFFHAMLNAFTQVLETNEDLLITVILTLIKISISIIIVNIYEKKKCIDKSA